MFLVNYDFNSGNYSFLTVNYHILQIEEEPLHLEIAGEGIAEYSGAQKPKQKNLGTKYQRNI